MKSSNLETSITSILAVLSNPETSLKDTVKINTLSLGKIHKTRNTFIVAGDFKPIWTNLIVSIRSVIELFPSSDSVCGDDSMEFTTDVEGLTMAFHLSLEEDRVIIDIDPTVGGHYIAYKHRIHSYGSDENGEWVDLHKHRLDVSSLLQESIASLGEEESLAVFKMVSKMLVKDLRKGPKRKKLKKKKPRYS